MRAVFVVGYFLSCCFVLHAAEESIARTPWNTSRIKGSPDPPKPYIPQAVFEKIRIENGLEMVSHNGRLFVVERQGKIWSFREGSTAQEADLFIDLKKHCPTMDSAYGIAFHPDWKNNHEVFLTYTKDRKPTGDGTRLSRFTFSFSDTEAPRIDPQSEEIILTWRNGGHNGAHLQFGKDGMLYISTGDATAPSPPDSLETGQDNSDILSSILRIDVDHKDEGLSYRIPTDNPYLNNQTVRPEIWAFGFRNPWKMSFNKNGHLWVGDVGWELWEMIHLVKKGSNHGWSAMEGSNPLKMETANPLSPITPPVVEHAHTEAASITGGYTYHGSRLPELAGAYIYGDYETGKIWALRHDGKQLTEHIEIADTAHKISTFGMGKDGQLYYIHYGVPSTIYRLIPNPVVGKSSDFPRKLSETGLFSDVSNQVPGDGVYQYRVHEPMWQDGAEATRYIALPGDSEISSQPEFRSDQRLRRINTTWPEDAVLAKTIRLNNAPVETQVLHYDGNTWNGYSYRWDESGSDAHLVAGEGVEFELPSKVIKPEKPRYLVPGKGNVEEPGLNWKGGPRYRIASRAECMRCHNMWNKFVPGFEPMQLAEFAKFPWQPARETAVQLGLTNGYFFHSNSSGHLTRSRGSGSIENRARSWLHANCAHCHRRHGGGSAPLEVNFERSLTESFTLWQRPTRGEFGLTNPRIIVPGEPSRSVLNYRLNVISNGHMPPLGSREVDEPAAKMLWDWVAGLPSEKTPGESSVNEPSGFEDTSLAMQTAQAIASGKIDKKQKANLIKEGLTSPNNNIRALFERFRSPAERPTPQKIDSEHLLSLQGDPENGAALLTTTGKQASCFACHKLGDAGGMLGPDLTQVGARLNREKLLESLTKPSKTIAPEYRLWIVETRSGEVFSGFVVERSERELKLRTIVGERKTILAQDIKTEAAQSLSLMPENLLNLLTAQEAADLLSYLESLR